MDRIGEPALVLDHLLQPIEVAPGAILDPWTPQIDQLAGGRRRGLTGEALAHDQGERVLDRRIGPVGDLVELAAVETVVEHRGEVLRHPLHAPRADRLDPRLLDRLEHGARLLPARLQAAVNRRIVAGEPKRDRIGVAAHDRRLLRIELARRLRQARLAPCEARPLRRKRDLELVPARDRPQATGHRPLEGLSRRLLAGRLGFGVRSHERSAQRHVNR